MRLHASSRALVAAAALLSNLLAAVSAVSLDINSVSSIKAAAQKVASGFVLWYDGGVPGNVASTIPGVLPALPLQPEWYWWEAGLMCGCLMDYWYYTGSTQYNSLVMDAMMFQTGPYNDYMPPNETSQEGNDDQIFWGFAAMTAAEYKFPNPPSDKPQWLELAQGVWNSQQLRWNTQYCGGGLRWQIFEFDTGYDYKNTPSNGGFMNLGARLYAYTGNKTYGDWATKTWDWMAEHKYIGGYKNYSIFDGAEIATNCTQVNPVQWTYSDGMLLNACAVMYNITGDDLWRQRALGIWESGLVSTFKSQYRKLMDTTNTSNQVFFNKDQIMFEAACEPYDHCDNDQLSFKAPFARFIAASTKWLPELYPLAQPYLQASAIGAAEQCDGSGSGVDGYACGMKWTQGTKWDGTFGFGQQFDALEIIQGLLIQQAADPVTADKGGISHGNPSTGTGGDTIPGPPVDSMPITTASRAGAGVLTAFVIIVWCSMIYFMV